MFVYVHPLTNRTHIVTELIHGTRNEGYLINGRPTNYYGRTMEIFQQLLTYLNIYLNTGPSTLINCEMGADECENDGEKETCREEARFIDPEEWGKL